METLPTRDDLRVSKESDGEAQLHLNYGNANHCQDPAQTTDK